MSGEYFILKENDATGLVMQKRKETDTFNSKNYDNKALLLKYCRITVKQG